MSKAFAKSIMITSFFLSIYPATPSRQYYVQSACDHGSVHDPGCLPCYDRSERVMFHNNYMEGSGSAIIKQANSENVCPPPRFFKRNMELSENVKFIGGVTLTRYILSTYVDSNNA